MDHRSKGIQGEEIVKLHYQKKGFEILESNYRYGRAEIDLIVLDREKRLVFVEVKMRNRRDYGEPETFVSDAQQQRIKEAAEEYIFGINWQKDIRFDIACVDTEGKIELFQDAF